ncbi:MAG: putative lipoprotein NlpC [Halanaerobiales bacterium]|nr:putative lipoprotein NlpC [Halanaerobiales bacterium]
MKIKMEKVIDRLLGIPYKHNGRSYRGVDCWGLIYLFFGELGINLPADDGAYIPEDWYLKEPGRYIRGLRTLGDEVGHYEQLQVLDLPYFCLFRNVITHSGVMIDNENFIHVLRDKEVSIDSMRKRYWKRKYAGAIRLRDDLSRKLY